MSGMSFSSTMVSPLSSVRFATTGMAMDSSHSGRIVVLVQDHSRPGENTPGSGMYSHTASSGAIGMQHSSVGSQYQSSGQSPSPAHEQMGSTHSSQ